MLVTGMQRLRLCCAFSRQLANQLTYYNRAFISSSAAPNKKLDQDSEKSASEPASNTINTLGKVNDNAILNQSSDTGKDLGPCILGMFVGSVNKELLTYPEIETTAELEAIHKRVEPVEKFFAENVNSAELDRDSEFLPPPLLAGLRQLNLFNYAASLSSVAQARLAECLSADASIDLTLRAHNSLGVRALLEGAKPELLQRLAGPLACGEQLAAFCLTEPGGGGAFVDPKSGIRCLAHRDIDSKCWRLNGTKIWVANAPVADVFVVLAITSQPSEDTDSTAPNALAKNRLTAFLVERSQAGVSVGPREVSLGARSAAIGALHLKNVIVPDENVLGEVDNGHKLIRSVVAAGRIAAGAAAAGNLKRLLHDAVGHCRVRRPEGLQPLSEYPMVQQKLARMAGSIYATESVAYLLAFLSDQFPNADLSPEAAALHLLSTKASLIGAADAAALAGGRSVASCEFPYERHLRDAWTLAGADASPDLARLQLAGRGTKFAGMKAAETASKILGAHGLLSKFRILRQANIGGESHMLAVHWHHNLAGVANSLEIQLGEFAQAVRSCLFYFREDLPNQQIIMQRIADCSVDLFTLIACCARASRSKSIGLRSADNELDLVMMLSKEAALRNEHNIAGLNIEKLYQRHTDGEFRRISDYACKFGGYAIDHALSRNWD